MGFGQAEDDRREGVSLVGAGNEFRTFRKIGAVCTARAGVELLGLAGGGTLRNAKSLGGSAARDMNGVEEVAARLGSRSNRALASSYFGITDIAGTGGAACRIGALARSGTRFALSKEKSSGPTESAGRAAAEPSRVQDEPSSDGTGAGAAS